jgi:shikimate kinase
MIRNLVLVGFMGSGKSTVGARAAEELGVAFVDLDRRIEEITSSTVSAIFAEFGEARFREFESAALAQVMAEPGQVVAVGGGAVAAYRNWKLAKENNLTVYLEVDLESALSRIGAGDGRPLARADAQELRQARLGRLLEDRGSRYRESDVTVGTEGRTVDEVLVDVLAHARAAGFGAPAR